MKSTSNTKPRRRVVDVPTTATAAEAEVLINEPYDEGYYDDYRLATGLPEGIALRLFYRLRVRGE